MKSRPLMPLLVRLLYTLWLGIWGMVFGPAGAWAQDAEHCKPQIQRIEVAKAASQGPIPAQETLEWTAVSLVDQWRDRWPHYIGSAWYRLDWSLPSCANTPVAVALNSIVMAGEVYVNRQLLWRDMQLSEPLSRSWIMPRYWLLPEQALSPGSNQIWIRVHGRSDDSAGLGNVYIGDPQELHGIVEQLWWNFRSVLLISVTVSMVIFVMFGFAWLQNRQYHVFGWYALNSLLWALLLSTALSTSTWPFSSSLQMARANGLIYATFALTFCIFVLRFANLRLPRLEKCLWAFTIATSVLILCIPDDWFYLTANLSLVYAAINVVICVWFPWHAWRSRKLEHLVFAAGIPIFILSGLHDLLGLLGYFKPLLALIPYTVPLTMLALALVLGRNLTLNMRRIEQFNVELTDSINRACDNLGSTLEREHALAMRHSLLQERMQLSHDLHDSLGGSLVRSIAYVEQSQQTLPKTQVLSMLKLMRDDLRQMIDNGTSAALSVPETPAQWVAPMRHRFGLLFEELELNVVWNVPHKWLTRPSAIQCLTLTRVLEEALTNVIKHSRAHKVTITLELTTPQELRLLIADNGGGFDVHLTQINSMGVGMRSMLARLERMQGTLQIQSQPGQTVLTARMHLGEGANPDPAQTADSMGSTAAIMPPPKHTSPS